MEGSLGDPNFTWGIPLEKFWAQSGVPGSILPLGLQLSLSDISDLRWVLHHFGMVLSTTEDLTSFSIPLKATLEPSQLRQ